MIKQQKGLFRYCDDLKEIFVLYNTKVLINDHFLKRITLNSGGFKTMSTKKAINSGLPAGYHLYQKDFKWYITTPTKTIDFEDNLIIDLEVL